MEALLRKILVGIGFDLEGLSEADQRRPLLELSGILFGIPWLLIALVWLISITDLKTVVESWPAMVLMIVLGILLSQFSFFQVARNDIGGYNYTSSNLSGIVLTSAVFLIGPVGVWLQVLVHLVNYSLIFPRGVQIGYRLNWARNLIFNIGAVPLLALLTVSLYQSFGGPIPLVDLSLLNLGRALAAMLVFLPGQGLLFELWVLLLRASNLGLIDPRQEFWKMTRQTSVFLVLAEIPSLFGILAAAIAGQMGVITFLVLIAGVLLVSILARWLSRAVMDSSQHSQELTQMERFGRAIIAAPPDTSTLPELLESYVPRMFGYRQVEVRLFEGRILLQLPPEHNPLPQQFWTWFEGQPQVHTFPHTAVLPWSGQRSQQQFYLVPILSVEKSEPLGGICLVHESWFIGSGTDLTPGLQGLAAQIASALHGAEIYEQTLAHEKVAQELAFAGRIQASFLPAEVPQVPGGWELAATVQPAKETSGDFYDFIPLPEDRWGLLVADVADKGMGAALVMAQARTLIRTYAMEYSSSPARALKAANERMLTDSAEGLFVTVFYGVLDPGKGELVYSNAGHNPPFLKEDAGAWPPKKLTRTGVPLGILEDQEWEEKTVSIAAGGGLVLYSDGLVEAIDGAEDLFGEARLLDVLERHQGDTALSIMMTMLEAVAEYSGDTPQFDDQTLMVVSRL